MKFLSWLFVNTAFAGSFYFGFIKSVDGAYNLCMFIAWVTIVFSFFCLSQKFIDLTAEREKEWSIAPAIDISFDTLMIAAFVWHDALITGTMYFMHMIILIGFRQQVDKAREKLKKN